MTSNVTLDSCGGIACASYPQDASWWRFGLMLVLICGTPLEEGPGVHDKQALMYQTH